MESTQSNAAAVRAFRVIEEVASQPRPSALTDLVDALDLPKQTLHRIVQQLQLAGLLVREPGTRRYTVSPRIEQFAVDVLMHSQTSKERHAILRGLVDEIGETCNLTTLVGTDIVYLDRVETSWPLRVHLAPGSHVPMYATATGKLLLALLPKAQRERLLATLPLRAMTSATITDRKRLAQELEETRKRGVGINRGEHLQGLIAVAVPVMRDKQRAIAAVAVQAPVGRKTLDELLSFVPVMQQAAAQIAKTFRKD